MRSRPVRRRTSCASKYVRRVACMTDDTGVPLPGGVASDIRLVQTPDGEVVVKAALPKLKVAADWFSDPARSATEVAALETMAELIGPDAVPRVLWSDPDRP